MADDIQVKPLRSGAVVGGEGQRHHVFEPMPKDTSDPILRLQLRGARLFRHLLLARFIVVGACAFESLRPLGCLDRFKVP